MTMHWMQFGEHPYQFGQRRLPKGIFVSDIARSLSHLNRFTGHTWDRYSVASHSVFVSELLEVDTMVAMYGLAHDAKEAIVGDISTPLKWSFSEAARKDFEAIEDAADEAVHAAFGLEWPVPHEVRVLVKRADVVALVTEKRDLMPSCSREWEAFADIKPHHRDVTFDYGDASSAAKKFMERFALLGNHLYGEAKTRELT
jgi:5'-deoxynucleotidase YfbR-like HD superfamily hydrolase